jgi:ATP-dependent RNA helicase DeaD
VSVAIIHSREKGKLKEIERIIGKKFERQEVPSPRHIIEKQIYNLADRLERVEVNDAEIDKYFQGLNRKLSWLSGEDLLKRVLSLEFNRLLDYYKDAPKIDIVDEKPDRKKRDRDRDGGEHAKPRNDKEKDRRTAERGMARVYVSVGKADGFFAGNLIEMLNKNVGGQRVDVGRIDLLTNYSLFDVKKGDAARVVQALRGSDFMGKRVYSEIADAEKDYAKTSGRRDRSKRRADKPRK